MSPNGKRSISPDSVVIEDDTEQQLEREEITRRLLGIASQRQVPASAAKVPTSEVDVGEDNDGGSSSEGEPSH
jgi:hypothetical protein